MLKYELRKMTDRPKGSSAALPPIEDTARSVREYRTALRTVLRGIAKETRESVIPAYREFNKSKRLSQDGLTQDAPEWFLRLVDLQRSLVRRATEMVERILQLEANRHSDRFRRDVRRTLGVDLKAVVRDEDLEQYLRDAVARNVSLITSVSDSMLKRIEREVYDAKISGRSVKDLRKRLTEQFGIEDRRAQLIASDQMGSLTSDLNKIRQQQAGITMYAWRTSRDERVRNGRPPYNHRVLDGVEYKWGEPTGAENGLPPGKPVRCRCVPIAKVEF